jgi:two-component system phosphate regulon response regulator PhoB
MGAKILVIDDDKSVRDIIVYILKNFEVVAFEDSKILKALDKCKPDLIILDNWLTEWASDATGEQLSRELKSNPATSHIPVLLISSVSNVKEIAAAGLADAYLHKPFDKKSLVGTVEHLLHPLEFGPAVN